MDGWDGWSRPQLPPPKTTVTEYFATRKPKDTWPDEFREIVWDRGMPHESRERITRDDPRWNEAETI